MHAVGPCSIVVFAYALPALGLKNRGTFSAFSSLPCSVCLYRPLALSLDLSRFFGAPLG